MALRDGVLVSMAPQGSEAWKSLRLGCLTGSRSAPVMVEKRPSATRDTLLIELVLERRTGKSPKEDYQSDAMLQGIEREAAARRAAEAEMCDVISEVGFLYWVGRHVGCSPDGVIGDYEQLVSIKCRELRAHYDHVRRGTIPSDAMRQMAHECWVTNCRTHNYVSFNPEFEPALRYRRVPLTWDKLGVDAYAKAAEVFLKEVDAEQEYMERLAAFTAKGQEHSDEQPTGQ
jgi:hypothetical protein